MILVPRNGTKGVAKLKESKKAKAFALFSQGFTPSSLEVKALGLQSSTRYKYHKAWEDMGKPAGTPGPSKPAMVSSTTLSGETIGAIDETKGKPRAQIPEIQQKTTAQEKQVPLPVVEEEPEIEPPELWPEDIPQEEARAKVKALAEAESIGGVNEVVTPKGKDGKPIGPEQRIATTVAEDGIKCTVLLSLQTLTLYSIAKSTQAQLAENGDGELSMGDFLDTCAADFFRVRGKKLGLINFGGK